MSNPDIALSGDWANTFVLKHSPNPSWDSGSTYAYYGLWTISSSTWNDSTTDGESCHIKVHTSTNEWSDHGGSHPGSNVSRSGETVTLRNNSGTIKATFTRPNFNTGTSTEGVAVESGSLTLVNGDVVYVVDSTSITHTYYLKIDGLFAGGLHSNWQHTAGTQSGGTFPNAQDGKYTLEYEESLAPFNHVKIAELRVGSKKVHCNFW